MAPPPGPYSGASTLALVARASAFTFGVVYGSIKLKVLKLAYLLVYDTCKNYHPIPAKAKSHQKAEAKAKAHH